MSVGETGEPRLSGIGYWPPVGSLPFRAGNGHDCRRHRRAAERICVLARHPLRQCDIAATLGVSRQALSQIVGRAPLPDTPMSWAVRRTCLAGLWPCAVDNSVVETHWYSVDSVVEQVRSAIDLGNDLAVRVLAGGEVAADVLRPWRVPTRGLAYATDPIDLSDVGLMEVTAEEATLTVRVPADSTVWATASWWHRVTDGEHAGIPTVDPVVVLEDLTQGNGPDDGARQRLIDWIVMR